MDSDFVRQLSESFARTIIGFVICAIFISSIITGVVVYSITKTANDPEKAQYQETVESLTPEQRKILGL